MNKIASLSAALLFTLTGAVVASDGPTCASIQRRSIGWTPIRCSAAHAFVNYCLPCHSAKYVRYARMTSA
jgi:hypothetical protein